MKSIFKKVVFGILLLPILLIVVALFLPSRYHVERSLVIHAGAETLFPYLNEPGRWPEWTAWTTNREPSLAFTVSGPKTGVGAVQSWTARSGSGMIKLLTSDPTNGVTYEFNINDGRFVASGRIEMRPATTGTNVTEVVWSSDGDLGRNPVGRYLGLFMDKMMGGDFELGLHNLKAKAEPKKP